MTIYDDIDATFGFQEFQTYLTRTSRFLHDTQTRYGSTLCNHHKASKIKWVERVASQSSEYEKDKRGQEVQGRRFDLWIELEF